jgi:hypothetical protein
MNKQKINLRSCIYLYKLVGKHPLRTTLVILVVFFFIGKSNAQYTTHNVLHDVELIVSIADNPDIPDVNVKKNLIYKVLEKYSFSDRSITEFYSALELGSKIELQSIKEMAVDQSIVSNYIRQSSISSTQKLFSVNTIADGLTKFLITRAKQELTATFFRKFSKALENEKNKILVQLFPSTVVILQSIDSELYRFSAYIETLRLAFIRDLRTIPGHLALALEDKKIIKDDETRNVTKLLLNLAQQINDGPVPSEIIQFLSEKSNYDSLKMEPYTKINSAFKYLNILSTVAMKHDGKGMWFSIDELDSIVHGDQRRQILTEFIRAFVVEQIDVAEQKHYLELSTKLDYVRDVIRYGSNLKNDIKIITDFKNDSINKAQFEHYAVVFSDIVEILKLSKKFIFNENPDKLDSVQFSLDRVLFSLDDALSIVLSVRQNEFSIAISHLGFMLNRWEDKVFDKNKRFQEFLRYGSFIAAVAESENADDVAKTIEAFALPVGSSSIKRNSKLNLAFNAYTGVGFGEETLKETDKKDTYIAAHVPIGLALSAGLGRGWSLSLYGTVIDLGAITTYRLDDESASDLPELEWENLLAPGIFGELGIKNWPISVGGGWQSGPQLRSIDAEMINIDQSAASRWIINVSVDLPIFNMYTSPVGIQKP